MWKSFILIFLLSFFVFNLNFLVNGATDTIPASILPFNIFSGDGLYFDKFYPVFKDLDSKSVFFGKFGTHIISAYPLISGILAIPIYVPIYIILRFYGLASHMDFVNFSYLLEKLSASTIAAISVSFFYILMFRLSSNKKESFIFSAIFAFATQTFPTSAQALWQHGPANLFLIISEIFLLKTIETSSNNKKNSVISLFFGSLAYASRIVFSIYYFFLFLLLSKLNRRWLYIAVFVLFTIPTLIYNLYFFHSVFGYYNVYIVKDNNLQINNVPNAFLGLFFSPSHGLFLYVPIYIVLFLIVFIFPKIKKTKIFNFFLLNLIYLLLGIVFYCLWAIWWGGQVWGARLLTDIAVPATILCYFVYRFIRHRSFRVIFYSMAVFSFLIQLVGVFMYPNAYWDAYPVSISAARSRLWDLHDNPLVRSIAIGPDFSLLPRWVMWYRLKIHQGLDHQKLKSYAGRERACELSLLSESSGFGYKKVNVMFKNKSSTDWVTVGEDLNSITLSQVFMGHSGIVVSPINPVNFPVTIKKGQEIKATLVIVPPYNDYKSLTVIPSQDGDLWVSSCRLNLDSKN